MEAAEQFIADADPLLAVVHSVGSGLGEKPAVLTERSFSVFSAVDDHVRSCGYAIKRAPSEQVCEIHSSSKLKGRRSSLCWNPQLGTVSSASKNRFLQILLPDYRILRLSVSGYKCSGV